MGDAEKADFGGAGLPVPGGGGGGAGSAGCRCLPFDIGRKFTKKPNKLFVFNTLTGSF